MPQTTRPMRLLLIVLVFGILLAAYFPVIRPWFLHWGATEAELKMSLPGDDLVSHPSYMSTRAVTINAPPEKVWPWLAQIGQERAGFYSYTWFENLLGADYHNATRIHPEWQDIKAGDFVWNMPESWRHGRFANMVRWQVTAAEPGRYFVLKNWGVFCLQPIDPGRTRLLVRGLIPKPSIPAFLPIVFVFDPGHFAMEKRMMLEVKRLAEGRPTSPLIVRVLAWTGFVIAAVIGTLIIITRRKKWPWVAAPLAWFLAVLLSTSDLQAALVAFVALTLIIVGFVAFRRKWWLYFLWWWIYVFSILIFASDAFLVFGILFLVEGAAVAAFSLGHGRSGPAA